MSKRLLLLTSILIVFLFASFLFLSLYFNVPIYNIAKDACNVIFTTCIVTIPGGIIAIIIEHKTYEKKLRRIISKLKKALEQINYFNDTALNIIIDFYDELYKINNELEDILDEKVLTKDSLIKELSIEVFSLLVNTKELIKRTDSDNICITEENCKNYIINCYNIIDKL